MVLVTEPTSAKVSCIARVRLKRCHDHRKASGQGHRRKKNSKPSQQLNEPADNSTTRMICEIVEPVQSEPQATSGPPGI
ncbi:hypothetical protein LXL04_016015 [Taraxacum kok-saghyz]